MDHGTRGLRHHWTMRSRDYSSQGSRDHIIIVIISIIIVTIIITINSRSSPFIGLGDDQPLLIVNRAK